MMTAEMVHDAYCPQSEACTDPRCGYRPLPNRPHLEPMALKIPMLIGYRRGPVVHVVNIS